MTAANRPVDHVRPLPPAVIGRGKDEMSIHEVYAMYRAVPDTRYGIGTANEKRPVVFESPLMAGLDEQGEVSL